MLTLTGIKWYILKSFICWYEQCLSCFAPTQWLHNLVIILSHVWHNIVLLVDSDRIRLWVIEWKTCIQVFNLQCIINTYHSWLNRFMTYNSLFIYGILYIRWQLLIITVHNNLQYIFVYLVISNLSSTMFMIHTSI